MTMETVMENDFNIIEENFGKIMDKLYYLEDDFAAFNSEMKRFLERYEDRLERDIDTGIYEINKEYEIMQDKRREIVDHLANMFDEFRLHALLTKEPSEYGRRSLRIRNIFRR